jgi:hypothetical protein
MKPAFALLFLSLTVAPAADVPRWVMVGVLHNESRSALASDGSIIYRDRRVGADGELGPFQMTRASFERVAMAGESFERLATDTAFAADLFRRWMAVLYHDYSKRDWFIATGQWNVGPRGAYPVLWRYAKSAQIAAAKQGFFK